MRDDQTAQGEIELAPEQVAAAKKNLRVVNARLLLIERERRELKENITRVAALLRPAPQ